VLAELGEKFRSKIFIKRGSYVVVDKTMLAERENKLDGEIVNVVRDERAWMKMGYWYVANMGWGIHEDVSANIYKTGHPSSKRNQRTNPTATKKNPRLEKCRPQTPKTNDIPSLQSRAPATPHAHVSDPQTPSRQHPHRSDTVSPSANAPPPTSPAPSN